MGTRADEPRGLHHTLPYAHAPESQHLLLDRQTGHTGLAQEGCRCIGSAGGPNGQRTLRLASNPNTDFLRPDAELVIVAISDDDDQSRFPNVVLRDRYYLAKNNHRSRVSVYAIAADVPNGCPGAAAPGTRYLEMVQATGGQFYSICEPDWSPVLRDLGSTVFVPQDRWNLSRTPDPTTIVVTVDGVVSGEQPVDGWTFDAAQNEIRFSGTAVPPPGTQILATYRPQCIR